MRRARPATGGRYPWPARGAFPLVLLYLAGIVTVDLLTPEYLRLDVYAAVAPVSAAALCTYRQTVLVAAVDCAIMVVTHGLLPSPLPTANRSAAIFGNLLMSGVAIAIAALRRDREELLDRVRATGEAAQRALLRQLPLRAGPVSVDGFYISAQRDALVGGDIYEAVEGPYGARVLIGDVQGKGLGTLGAGAAVLTAFREAAYHRRSLESAVAAMEEGLHRHYRAAGVDEEGRFVTALVFGAEAPEEDAPTLVFVDCGHVPPYLLGPDGEVRELDLAEPGLPLGLGELNGPRRARRIRLPPDTRVLACTDGVTEARNERGAFYPLADRLRLWAALPTAELVARLCQDLTAYRGGRRDDDVAVLVLGATAPEEESPAEDTAWEPGPPEPPCATPPPPADPA
ncbi:PP2C family protein-serine/threonine phosphatase [Streptomyces sp. URMC 123]|uniref:PP2C family protein-serine/threonine phosphatase n=1 Tax=Streptomyces sp. URMC 123 TaxID=3423403 RepID=UPI003F1CA095